MRSSVRYVIFAVCFVAAIPLSLAVDSAIRAIASAPLKADARVRDPEPERLSGKGREIMRGHILSAFRRGYLGLAVDRNQFWTDQAASGSTLFADIAGGRIADAGDELERFLLRHDDMPTSVKLAKVDELAAAMLSRIRVSIREFEGLPRQG